MGKTKENYKEWKKTRGKESDLAQGPGERAHRCAGRGFEEEVAVLLRVGLRIGLMFTIPVHCFSRIFLKANELQTDVKSILCSVFAALDRMNNKNVIQ